VFILPWVKAILKRLKDVEDGLVYVLEWIEKQGKSPSTGAVVTGTIAPPDRTEKILTMSLSTNDSDTQTYVATLAELDSKNLAAAADSVPVWTVDDSDVVVALTAAADGMTATFTIGTPGSATISATVTDPAADTEPDPTTGAATPIPPFVVPFAVTVVGGPPVSGTITVAPQAAAPAPDAPAGAADPTVG
jgi:hypothetical protein